MTLVKSHVRCFMLKNPKIVIILLAYLSLFGLGLTDNIRGALFPEVVHFFSVNNSQGAYFFISTSIFSVLSSVASRKLLLKFPPLTLWKWGVFFMSLGALGISFSPQFSLLMIACAILGVGFGILGVTQNLLVSLMAPPKYKKRILSGLHSMYGLASFFAPMMVAQLIGLGFHWQVLFMIASLIVICILMFSFFYKSSLLNAYISQAEDQGHQLNQVVPFNQAAPLNSNIETVDNPLLLSNAALPLLHINVKNAPETKKSKKKFLVSDNHKQSKNNDGLYLSLSLAFYVCLELLFSTRLTTYLKNFFHWSLIDSSRYLTYFFLFLLSGRILFTFFHPPLSTRKMLYLSLLSSLFTVSLGLKINPFFLCLSGLFFAPFYPLAIAHISEIFPDKVSSVMSLTISLQSFVFIIANFSIGFWTDHFGIENAMYFAYLFGGLSWFCLMKLQKLPE